jgi:hypothetical protein
MLYQTVSFGSSKAGLSTVGYRLYDGNGDQIGDRITTNIQDLGGGQYGAVVAVPDNFVGRITWDSGELTPVYASAELNTPDFQVVTDTVLAAIKSLNIKVNPERVVLAPIQPTVVKPTLPKRCP